MYKRQSLNAAARGYKLALPGETQRYPGSVHVRGNFFIAAAFKLEHDGEQLRHLMREGKLPPPFRHLADAYSTIYRGIQRAQRSQFMTQKLLSTAQHALLFGLCGNQISSAHSMAWRFTKAILLRVTQVTA